LPFLEYFDEYYVQQWPPHTWAYFGRAEEAKDTIGTQASESFHSRHDTVFAPPASYTRSLPEYAKLLFGEAKYWESLVSNPVSWSKHKADTAQASAKSTTNRTAAIEWLRNEKASIGLKLAPRGTSFSALPSSMLTRGSQPPSTSPPCLRLLTSRRTTTSLRSTHSSWSARRVRLASTPLV
jgi:hypothetical protein